MGRGLFFNEGIFFADPPNRICAEGQANRGLAAFASLTIACPSFAGSAGLLVIGPSGKLADLPNRIGIVGDSLGAFRERAAVQKKSVRK